MNTNNNEHLLSERGRQRLGEERERDGRWKGDGREEREGERGVGGGRDGEIDNIR